MSKQLPRWEYQVIRLNIDPGEAAPNSPPASADKDQNGENPSSRGSIGQQPFSESYLKEEFPNFYQPTEAEIQAAQLAAQQNDPAFQLQHFLNLQGNDGWELIGINRAGPHEFVLFKRAIPEESTEAVGTSSEQLRLTLELATKCLSLMEKDRQTS